MVLTLAMNLVCVLKSITSSVSRLLVPGHTEELKTIHSPALSMKTVTGCLSSTCIEHGVH